MDDKTNEHISNAQREAKRGTELSRCLNFEKAFNALSASGEELLVAAKCCAEDQARSQAILLEASRIISMAEDIKVMVKGPSARRIQEAVQMYTRGLESEQQSKRKYALYFYIKAVEIMLPIASLIKRESPRSYKYLDRGVVDIMHRAERLKRLGIVPSRPELNTTTTMKNRTKTFDDDGDEEEEEQPLDKTLYTTIDGVSFPKELVQGVRSSDFEIIPETKSKSLRLAIHRGTKASAAIVVVRVGKDVKMLRKTARRIRDLQRVIASERVQCVRNLESCAIESIGDMKEVICVFSGNENDDDDDGHKKWISVSELISMNVKRDDDEIKDEGEKTKKSDISEWQVQSLFRSIISTCVVLHSKNLKGFIGPDHIFCNLESNAVNLCAFEIPKYVMKLLPFAPPEIQSGSSNASEMSDMWCIGALLFRFFFNQYPVLIGEKVKFPKGCREYAGDRACNLLEKLLRRDPADRLRARYTYIFLRDIELFLSHV